MTIQNKYQEITSYSEDIQTKIATNLDIIQYIIDSTFTICEVYENNYIIDNKFIIWEVYENRLDVQEFIILSRKTIFPNDDCNDIPFYAI